MPRTFFKLGDLAGKAGRTLKCVCYILNDVWVKRLMCSQFQGRVLLHMSLDLRAKVCAPGGNELVLRPSCQKVVGDDLNDAIDESLIVSQRRK